MPQAQCFYEILGISETATTDEVKKAYKKQALEWHPDKNQANAVEAHARFQSILKAYETLSDNREREWYDRHKDQILSEGDKDSTEAYINLFSYFSSSCYANFDDSEDGFYTVYRNVFNQIAEEEKQAIRLASRLSSKSKNKQTLGRNNKEDSEFPSFGSSQSEYEQMVRPFYAFWSGFCTNVTFDHLDKYNTTEAENRRILRAMEKENKKVKDVARRERNTNIRNLVEFIKRRDKRLKAHKLLIEQQNELNRQKTLEKQRQQREKCLKTKSEYKQAAYLDLDDVEEQLRQLEEEYESFDKGKRGGRKARCVIDGESDEDDESLTNGELTQEDTGAPINDGQVSGAADNEYTGAAGHAVGDDSEFDDEEEQEEEEEESFFCPACNKDFRSVNAFENHEASKKHKQNVQKLTKLLKADESKLNK